MVKQFLKKKSKRVSTKKRCKIEKKVREHNRKLKKLNKQNGIQKKGKKKLIIVPGDCPFKEQILAEAAALRESIAQQKAERKEKAKADKKALKDSRKKEPVIAPHNISAKKSNVLSAHESKPEVQTFEELLKKAQQRGYAFQAIQEKKQAIQANSSLKAFYKEFQQVISESDVVIQVLDSRDPLGTRSVDAEDCVRSKVDKKLLFVLNKSDLVPSENLQKWISYLKKSTGCAVIPFKANTQKQKDRLGSIAAVNTIKGTDTKKSAGVSDLLGILGTWAKDSAGGVTVGVVGMPNVGKSSLINSLKRSRACNVGAKPGVTRTCQVIHLDSKLRLIDSPGICLSKEGSDAISLEKIMARVPKTTLMLHYRIPDFKDPEEFLMHISQKYGMLKKGGVGNTSAAENKVVHDWHTGQLRFFTEPPEETEEMCITSLVPTMSKPFSLDNCSKEDLEVEMEDVESESEDVAMDPEPEDIEDAEDVPETKTPPTKGPSPRLTRSAAKRKGVTFSIDTTAIEKLRGRKSTKKNEPVAETLSAKSKISLGMVGPKKTLDKKIKKSKKKVSKKADQLSEVVKNLSF